ncbi:AAA family ATPase [Enterococcus faecalis]|uniref:AAA family ATPase n=1 Tax=Enterococcus TaxID=1350 RepID=UPI000352C9BD|nr:MULTISPECIES: AAA family ATPase [Enterococcus]EGO6029283.1 AAA family ATPase [Enterococcus faecalis]EGO6643461.1 AAA family ATPase [Enterococcus faecalis]EGO8332102.1 AAA family ATPase [Enterococcus faecalis]EGO8788114.1 hypothetical protein [Enterococcus faecalis]EHE8516832.1 AAA family ATPase [Enterococcus faecalis]
MKKPINLLSLIESFENLTEETFKKNKLFLEFDIRDTEIYQIKELINNFNGSYRRYSYFYIGYTIPQINKEFDLLRFGDDYILNIELKTGNNKEKAYEQLNKNKYYLSSQKKKLFLFTYFSDENTIYSLTEGGDFHETTFNELSRLIDSQAVMHVEDIDSLFDPTIFLISPFNSTELFMENSYFLTLHQEEIKRKILDSNKRFEVIIGRPGTGKSLLLYDLAKEYFRTCKIAIIHCGILNLGHLKLKQQYGMNIVAAKDCLTLREMSPDVIFVDETQRFKPSQLEFVIDYVKENEIKAIFSIDPKQILGVWEKDYKNLQTIIDTNSYNQYELGEKIRSNKELAAFVKGIQNLDKMHYCKCFDNISLHYFSSIESAKDFANEMTNEGWQVIDYTAQKYGGHFIERMKLDIGPSVHGVVGQEFDNVLVLLGDIFYYGTDNRLTVRYSNHYDPERMFYQAITRSRKKIMLVVVNNNKLYTDLINKIKLKEEH